ncbi:expressed unknown protein [Seminavis robusta]|uniref:Uncharacterized protein n=1 Tax=Seminavis robusta TaxID=568900 RepID=A0A9N8H656_9STRA|nr:expressed unknown protein [Seminavis robusta]|eukprot:Sro37_g023200.1 n/a (299) ;mRNA; f:64063-64959
MAAVVIQRNFRGSNIFGRALKRKNSAASMIQAKFIEWKLNISLLAVQSSLVLLKRTPSASFFAIQHINRELQAAMLFSRSLTLSGGDWDQAIADFENHASIIIQRAVKRLLVKKQAVAHWNSISAEARLSSDTNFGLASGDNELLSWLLMFQVRQALEEQNQSARSIQRWCLERSRWLAACVVIQSRVRVWLARRRVYRLNVQRAAKRCAEFYDELEATLLARVYRAASEQAQRDVKHLLSHDEPSKVPSKSGICVRRIAQRVVLGRLRAENEKDEVNSAKDLLAAEQGRVPVDRLVL